MDDSSSHLRVKVRKCFGRGDIISGALTGGTVDRGSDRILVGIGVWGHNWGCGFRGLGVCRSAGT